MAERKYWGQTIPKLNPEGPIFSRPNWEDVKKVGNTIKAPITALGNTIKAPITALGKATEDPNERNLFLAGLRDALSGWTPTAPRTQHFWDERARQQDEVDRVQQLREKSMLGQIIGGAETGYSHLQFEPQLDEYGRITSFNPSASEIEDYTPRIKPKLEDLYTPEGNTEQWYVDPYSGEKIGDKPAGVGPRFAPKTPTRGIKTTRTTADGKLQDYLVDPYDGTSEPSGDPYLPKPTSASTAPKTRVIVNKGGMNQRQNWDGAQWVDDGDPYTRFAPKTGKTSDTDEYKQKQIETRLNSAFTKVGPFATNNPIYGVQYNPKFVDKVTGELDTEKMKVWSLNLINSMDFTDEEEANSVLNYIYTTYFGETESIPQIGIEE